MKNPLNTCLLVVVAVTLLTCSDGAEPTPPNPGGGNKPGAILNLTDEQRLAVLEECSKFAGTIGDLKTDAAQQKLVTWLKARPEFEEAGTMGGNVWAHFYDGRIAMMLPDWLSDPATGGRLPMTEPDEEKKNTGSETARESGIPTGNEVKLFWGLGKVFTDDRAYLKSLFLKSHTSYNTEANIKMLDATVENLKTVKGVSVFYIAAHGGLAPLKPITDSISMFGLTTKEPISPAKEVTYKEQLDNDELTYMFAVQDFSNAPAWHYGITEIFVQEHMTFKENAILYIDACSGMHKYAERLREAMLKKSEGYKATYIGWTDPTDSYIIVKTARFVFDRLLGTQMVSPESPSQRPFDLISIFNDLPRWDLGKSIYGGQWTYYSKSTSEILLTPSIEYITMYDFSDQMIIKGLFGDNPGAQGKVTVAGQAVKILKWEHNQITCELPSQGPGSSGNVIVSVGKNDSNTVPLSEWNIPLDILNDKMGLKIGARLNLRIRGDVHRYRKEAGKDPITERSDSIITSLPGFLGWPVSRASNGEFGNAGEIRASCTSGDCTVLNVESVAYRKGDLKLNAPPATPGFVAYYKWSRDLKKIYVRLVVNITDIAKSTQAYHACPGSPVQDDRKSFSETLVMAAPGRELPVLEFTLDENYAIRKSGFPYSHDMDFGACNLAGKLEVSALWPEVKPSIAPIQNTEARIGQ